MRRRKDSGFTLIELMIVIAVIGILAIVLVPRVGTVKAQAKEAGLDTNIRVVQGYVESKIDKWVSKDVPNSNAVADIVAAFSGNKALVNPVKSVSGNAGSGADGTGAGDPPVYVLTTADGAALTSPNTNLEGSIVIAIDGDPVDGVNIYAYDSAGNILSEKEVNIVP